MPKLPKFTLVFNDSEERWDLTKDKIDRVVKSFLTKEAATKRGALKKAVGSTGGSVKIQTKEGDWQEERTYPSSADPHKSKG